MRLISPALPGLGFIAAAAAEVGLLVTQGQPAAREVVPLWVQMIPVAIIFAIGSWGIVRLFAHERDTARKFEELEDHIQTRDDARHRENQQAISTLAAQQTQMNFLLMGIQGQGGLLDDKAKNQERRHELAQEITIIYALLREQAVFLTRVGERIKLPFEPAPVARPRRRRGEEDG